MKHKKHYTAAITSYLIERIGRRVALCESQGDQWITIERDIDRSTAASYGFNLASPQVQAVFNGGKTDLELGR